MFTSYEVVCLSNSVMMMHKVEVKKFQKLNLEELYQILRLRSAVFVVEQNCPYQDIDNKDQESLHLLYYVEDKFAGYTRLLPAGVSYAEVSIGRVITNPDHRGLGVGKKLMTASIEACYARFGHVPIRIGAQVYLLKFYQSLGFVAQGDVYDEDGIPHVEMLKSL